VPGQARAVRIHGAGDVDVLKIENFEPPTPGPGEILIKVAAAGLNRADCLQRRGFYPAPPGTVPDIPGLEYAGTVAGRGEGATRFSEGEPVMGICAGGSMATHLVVHEDTALSVPGEMDLAEAAAIPEVFITAYDALQQGGLVPGAKVLIHAVGSGVGTAALQLVNRKKAIAIGSSRTATKLARAEELGLTESILVEEGKFAKALRARDLAADIILDFVGAGYLGENIKALAPQGRLVVIGLLSGVRGELPLGLLLAKRAHVIGTVLRSRSLAEKCALAKDFAEQVMPGFASGELVPIVDRVVPMQEIAEAHRYMESNQSFGKIVMRW
jgi:NADPH2:quinone reductase